MKSVWCRLLLLSVLVSGCLSKEVCDNVYLVFDKYELEAGDSLVVNCSGCTTLTLEIETELDESEFSDELVNETQMSSLVMKQWIRDPGEIVVRCRSSQTSSYKEFRLPVVESTHRRRGVHNPKRRFIMKAMTIRRFAD